jgi:protein gp37
MRMAVRLDAMGMSKYAGLTRRNVQSEGVRIPAKFSDDKRYSLGHEELSKNIYRAVAAKPRLAGAVHAKQPAEFLDKRRAA